MALDLAHAAADAPVALVVYDRSLRIVDCNQALAAVFGVPRASLIGFDLSAMNEQVFMRALAGERATWSGTYGGPLVGLSGSLRVAPVCDGDGAVIGGCGVIHLVEANTHVTERLRLEEQFRQSQKMEAIGQLAGGVAHDFNNLLAVIATCGEFLAEEIPPSNPMSADVEEIRRAAERAAELVRKLLTFSRRQVLQVRAMSINDIVGGTREMLRRLIPEPIAIAYDLGLGVGAAMTDAGQLEQVVMNLALNARDAMASGGTLTIATRICDIDASEALAHGVAPGRYVVLSVADTGVGIAPEVLPRVFEPFFTTKELGRGTGLGLSTVYGIAQQLHAFVRVSSELGHGTRFELALPAVAAPVPSAGHPSRTVVRTRAKILLVEDESGVRAVARRILERAGYDVVVAADGAEALGLATDEIDLMLTDFVMPDMNGRELHSELGKRFPEMAVLYMSGYVDDAAVRSDSLGKTVPFVAKPFTAQGLVDAVRMALAGHGRVTPRGDPLVAEP